MPNPKNESFQKMKIFKFPERMMPCFSISFSLPDLQAFFWHLKCNMTWIGSQTDGNSSVLVISKKREKWDPIFVIFYFYCNLIVSFHWLLITNNSTSSLGQVTNNKFEGNTDFTGKVFCITKFFKQWSFWQNYFLIIDHDWSFWH